jgi:hypothetical protein
MNPETTPGRVMADTGTQEVTAAVYRMVTAADPGAFIVEPIFPGAQSTTRVPVPVAAVRAALLLSRLAERDARRHVRRAREAGVTWADLAPAVDAENAEAAYDWAAGASSDPWRSPTVLWRCPSCGELVTDHGPYESHPTDRESGHAAGCPRHTGEIAAWQRALDTWDDDNRDQGDDQDSGSGDEGSGR